MGACKVADGVEQGGFASAFFVRIAPVPCFIKNYSLPVLTEIPWSAYVPATLLGLLPTTGAHVYAGTLATSVRELATGGGAAMHAVAISGVVASAGLLSLLGGYYLHSLSVKDEELEESAGEKAEC